MKDGREERHTFSAMPALWETAECLRSRVWRYLYPPSGARLEYWRNIWGITRLYWGARGLDLDTSGVQDFFKLMLGFGPWYCDTCPSCDYTLWGIEVSPHAWQQEGCGFNLQLQQAFLCVRMFSPGLCELSSGVSSITGL